MKASREHKSELEALLCENGVSVRPFADFKQLQAYLERL